MAGHCKHIKHSDFGLVLIPGCMSVAVSYNIEFCTCKRTNKTTTVELINKLIQFNPGNMTANFHDLTLDVFNAINAPITYSRESKNNGCTYMKKSGKLEFYIDLDWGDWDSDRPTNGIKWSR